MSIEEKHLHNIAQELKTHEFRKYVLSRTVERVWLYTAAPISAFEYVAEISPGKQPGEVTEDRGFGNVAFHINSKRSNSGYKIQGICRLLKPISLCQAIRGGYFVGPPRKFMWALPEIALDHPLTG